MKKTIAALLVFTLSMLILPSYVFAASDSNNGNWSDKYVSLRNTSEAELMVRVGDIDAFNEKNAVKNGYNPFTAEEQRSHDYPWDLDSSDPMGTDRIYVGSHWNGGTDDGYSQNYDSYQNGGVQDKAFGDGALKITMNYDIGNISVKNAVLQLCIDDFEALKWGSNFSVSLNGKDAPFAAEIFNNIAQSGPTSYIISVMIPSGFFNELKTGSLTIEIDENVGNGDGFAVDFAKLLINYNDSIFNGEFSGTTDPGATVRLLGTNTTIQAGDDGSFNFEAVPGLNAVRVSKPGYVEKYDYGIVLKSGTDWRPSVYLSKGEGNKDIDFSKFASTHAWSNASEWATPELQKAEEYGLIPDVLIGADMTMPISRAEFAAVAVKTYESLSDTTTVKAATNPFSDTNDTEVLKAYNSGIAVGTSATTFEPNSLLNREEAATMLARVFKKSTMKGWSIDSDTNYPLSYNKSSSFADDMNISGWAKDSVYFMAANGIIAGVGNNNFAPKNVTSKEEATFYANATREQALLIAVRMIDNLK